jgi:hypothetical protein
MDLTGAILLTGIGIVIGFLFAALFFTLRRRSSPEPPSEERVLTDSESSIRIWREGKERRLVIEMDGVSHYQESELHTEQSRRITGLLGELQAWMDVSPSAVSPIQSDTFKPAASTTGEETKSTSLNPLKIFSRSLQPLKKAGSSDPDLSIVAQVDEILQSKLEGIHLDDQGIRLVEGPDQGMVIEVGLNRYTEIDAVPDERVRQLIRLSVAEWESSLGD